MSDGDWNDTYLEKLRLDVEDKLSGSGFDVAYRKYAPLNSALRLYAVDFVVSFLCSFPLNQVLTIKKGYVGFRIRAKPFLKAKATLKKKIADALKLDYVINNVAFEYAASRTFVFEVYLEGSLGIEYALPSSNIDDADGRVREAIEQFNNEVVDLFASSGWYASPKTTTRRPKDNIYKFEVSATKNLSYTESEVGGPVAQLEKNTTATAAADLGIELADWPVHDSEHELRHILETESSYELSNVSVECIDFDEDVWDIIEELVV